MSPHLKYENQIQINGIDANDTVQRRANKLLPQLQEMSCEKVKKVGLAYVGLEKIVRRRE